MPAGRLVVSEDLSRCARHMSATGVFRPVDPVDVGGDVTEVALMSLPTLEDIFSQLAVEQDTAATSREIADLIRA